jgi:hypothetical protein
MKFYRRLLLTALMIFLTASVSFAQVPPPPPQQVDEPEERPLLPRDFQPGILKLELLRAMTTGNPPGQSLFIPVSPPILLSRPDDIPLVYPAGLNDGILFLNP